MLLHNRRQRCIGDRVAAHQNEVAADQSLGVKIAQRIAQASAALRADHLHAHLDGPRMLFDDAVPAD